MLETQAPLHWRAVHSTVTGAAHLRAGVESQDAVSCLPPEGMGPPLLAILADGHGSPKCFRSQIGARAAVEVALTRIPNFLRKQEGALTSALKRVLEDELPKVLVRAWHECVENDLADHPFREDELSGLQEQLGQAAVEAVRDSRSLAYGSTLLCAALTDEFILYLQLGDGDILTVSDAGAVTWPLPSDEELLGNETTSLCSPEAASRFRVVFQPLLGLPAPALILMSTDGLRNSFEKEEGFLQVASDLLQAARRDGVQRVTAWLEAWLTSVSQAGSGDDLTIGIIYRLDALNPASQQNERASSPETV